MKKLNLLLTLAATRILPPILALLAVLRPLLTERAEQRPILPLETTATLLMVASIFLLATPLEHLPGIVTTTAVIGISILPSLGVILGGWLFPKFKIPATLLWVLPFLIDAIVAISLGSLTSGALDVGMILLYGILLASDMTRNRKTNEHI